MISRIFGILAFSALIFTVSTERLPAAGGAPEALIQAASAEVFKAAADSSPQAAFRRVLKERMDLPALASFSLGKYLKKMPKAQMAEYRQLMEDNIVALFAKRATSFRGEKMSIQRVTPRGEKEFIVKTKVQFASGDNKSINWRVAERGGTLRIFDVNVDGIWLAILQRDAFVGTIDKANGDVNALLAALKKGT